MNREEVARTLEELDGRRDEIEMLYSESPRLTQKELAERLGISLYCLRKWEISQRIYSEGLTSVQKKAKIR